MKSHTIGEVLNRLKDEFDDITISKIRFLEAEGLISPDRTESGYRKFTEQDIDRLRYVLRAQRDRYLPLKVIKDELARLDAGMPLEAPPAPAPPAADVGGDAAPSPAPFPAEAGAAPASAPPAAASTATSMLQAAPSEVSLSSTELTDTTGLTDTDLASLRDHGLLGSGPRYDGDDLRVATLAAELLGAGLEVRHLRMYRQFADREFALVEQLVSPLLRQRNPDSRATAREHAEQLARAGGDLHRALLARELRTLLRS